MKKLWLLVGVALVILGGCTSKQEVERLRAENDSLKRQVDSLTQKLANVGYNPNASSIEQLIKNQTPTFTMLTAMPGDYVEQKLILYGYAELAGYYNYGYGEAQNSHYSVSIWDLDGKKLNVYFSKQANKELFELLGKAGSNAIPLKVEIIELRTRYREPVLGSQFFAEGLSWEVLK